MPQQRYLSAVTLAACLLLLLSCSRDPSAPPAPTPRPIATEALPGHFSLPDASTLSASDLVVVTFADTALVAADGTFEVDTPQSSTSQMVFLCSRTTGRAVCLGVREPDKANVDISDSTTALSLALMNPFFMQIDEPDRRAYMAAVIASPRFPALLARLRDAYARDAAKALDYDTNPGIYQDTGELIRDAMTSLGGKADFSADKWSDPPTIRDVSGPEIEFVNGRHIYYGAGIYQDDATLREVVTVDRIKKVVSVRWGWPPIVVSDPVASRCALGDGDFRIHLAKGLDYSRYENWNDPVGRATQLNTFDGICYLVQFVAGQVKLPSLATMSNGLHVSPSRVLQFESDIRNRDAGMFVVHFAKLMSDNADALAYMFWNDGEQAAIAFIQNAAWLVDNVALALRIVALGNEQGPFFLDLVLARSEIDYTIRQTDGVVVEVQEDLPPTAEFIVSPRAGIVGTPFAFQPAGTLDDHDPAGALLYRWDWESDGIWDVPWAGASSLIHAYNDPGAHAVTLEVRDTAGLVGSVSHTVNVGGGAGSASHVKVFRDNIAWYREDDPWYRDALLEVLQGLGFTPGPGYHQYEVLPSSSMGTAELVPGVDLIIISNDQDQSFYNGYAANQVRFTSFIYDGGSLLWEACDEGWAEGSMANAGVILPYGIHTQNEFCYLNYVITPELPLVAGLPTTMDHHFASHEGLMSVPDDATIYCVDEYWQPTLVEFNLGRGWVMVTSQPLEHQYRAIYGSPDMEQLLPRIVSYFVGIQPADAIMATTPSVKVTPGSRSSSGAPSARE